MGHANSVELLVRINKQLSGAENKHPFGHTARATHRVLGGLVHCEHFDRFHPI
jgi:hypothetical protein